MVKVTKIASGQPMAQRDKCRPIFFRREVRLRLLYFAADALESFERIPAEVQHARFHRKVVAEVTQPANPRAVEVTLQRLEECSGVLLDGERTPRIVSGHD